jgi:hypothetical protein
MPENIKKVISRSKHTISRSKMCIWKNFCYNEENNRNIYFFILIEEN